MCPRSPTRKEQVSSPLLRPLSPTPPPPIPVPVPAGGRVLQIPLVRAEDAGRYSCKASNEVGEDWLHYELMVLSEWPAWGWEGGVVSAGPMRPPTPGVTVGSMVSLAGLGG